jgi:hypothetical protein
LVKVSGPCEYSVYCGGTPSQLRPSAPLSTHDSRYRVARGASPQSTSSVVCVALYSRIEAGRPGRSEAGELVVVRDVVVGGFDVVVGADVAEPPPAAVDAVDVRVLAEVPCPLAADVPDPAWCVLVLAAAAPTSSDDD